MMKALLSLATVVVLVLLAGPVTPLAAENGELPRWAKTLAVDAGTIFKTHVATSPVRELDRIEGREFDIIRLEGEGSLEKVPDPFEDMRGLFLSGGWREDERYAADGHGSSSTGYWKGALFCVAGVRIDSSCDDEETGHEPSAFWFSIDCRHRGAARQ